ncbi:unnamed protein product [Prunus armeniaca]
MESTVFVSIPLVRISFQGWQPFYPRLFYGDSIVIPERVAFRSRVDLCQSLAKSDSQLAGFVGLLAQVVQVVRVLLDCSVRGVFFGEDVRQLLEAADRPGWQGVEPILGCSSQGVENCFEGAACSISAVKGVEFAWSISLRSTSSKFLPVFKSRSRSFTSFSMSYTHIVGRSRWRR